ncbi:hypothetical protein E5288_WYG006708 [Bos mutus]|uniref:Uncharacterized protein n=1 Tax=Bos mutus TaxID=72004 RepID=A0A6B0RHV9_9CETA|nr:hypothetical protein [Bos mutus]
MKTTLPKKPSKGRVSANPEAFYQASEGAGVTHGDCFDCWGGSLSGGGEAAQTPRLKVCRRPLEETPRELVLILPPSSIQLRVRPLRTSAALVQADRSHVASSSGWSTAPGVRGPCDENAFLMLFDEDDENVTELSS